MKKLVFLFSLFICGIANAADSNWYATQACTGTTYTKMASDINTSSTRELLYNCFGASTGTTNVVDSRSYFNFCFDTDSTASATGAARVFLSKCMTSAFSVNTCERIHVDKDSNGSIDTTAFDGTVGVTQNRCVFDIPPGFYAVEVTTGRAGSEAPLVTLQVQK
jgi:hypothetical protein